MDLIEKWRNNRDQYVKSSEKLLIYVVLKILRNLKKYPGNHFYLKSSPV